MTEMESVSSHPDGSSNSGIGYGGENVSNASQLADTFLSQLDNDLTKKQNEQVGDFEMRDHFQNRDEDEKKSSDRERRRRRRSRSRSTSRSRRRDRERRSRRDRDRDRDRDRERDRDRDRERDRDRDSNRERGERNRERERASSRDKDRSAKSRHSSKSRRSRSRSVTPIHKRARKLRNWDVAPPGYEGMTSEQVKATGHFPLPGQLTKLAGGTAPPGMMASNSALFGQLDMPLRLQQNRPSQSGGGQSAQNATVIRQAKRLYVGNIPFGIQESNIAEFFNNKMLELNLKVPHGNAVISVQINHDKNYAFLEFRTSEEATAAMAFDGISFQSQVLKIRRPKDYQPLMDDGESPQSVLQTSGPHADTPHKIFVGGLPSYLNEEQVMELLKSFGPLKAFNLVKDSTTGLSKGFAFCEYVDPNVTDVACHGLNNMELGDKKLVVQRASVGAKTVAPIGLGVGGIPAMLPVNLLQTEGHSTEPTTVLQLLNMVRPDELVDDEEYEDILEDVYSECQKFGKVNGVKIPRPSRDREVSGLGKIFVWFERIEDASKAMKSLAGRKFSERTVIVSYITLESYHRDEF